MLQKLKDVFSGFGFELIEGLRERHYDSLEERAFYERTKGIENATAALCEAKVKDDLIVSLLIKYWNIRPSDAKDFLQQTKKSLRQQGKN